jgi:hypothetical protein
MAPGCCPPHEAAASIQNISGVLQGPAVRSVIS